jgi:hypothetical protein
MPAVTSGDARTYRAGRVTVAGCDGHPDRVPFVRARPGQVSTKPEPGGQMKKLVELLLCFLHPIAVILMWINLAGRTDLGTGAKLAWAILGIIPLVPFVFVLTGNDLF